MKIDSLTVIVIAVCLVKVNANNFAATISCQACSIACAFSQCYRITTDDYDQQICGTQSCDLKYRYMEIFGKCTYDFLGDKCSTGVCYLPEPNGCARGQTQCTASSWTYFSCQTCQSTTNCANCISKQTSTATEAVQSCFGDSCNEISPLNITIGPCSSQKDPYGNSCPCCYKIENKTGRYSVCTNLHSFYGNSDFNTYAQQKSSQRTLYLAISLLFCLFVTLLN